MIQNSHFARSVDHALVSAVNDGLVAKLVAVNILFHRLAFIQAVPALCRVGAFIKQLAPAVKDPEAVFL